MRYLFFFCTFLFAIQNAAISQTKGWVVLTGSTKNFNNQVEVQDMSEMSDLLLPDADRFFVPDAEGHFKVKFKLASPNYFRMGRNILYLSPGDSLVMFVDYNNPKLASFSGTHSRENEYLRETPFPKGGSFLEAGTKIKSTVDSSVMAVEEAADQRTASLAGYTDVSKEFTKLETARIKADLINSLLDIRPYFPMRRKLSKDSTDAFQKNFEQTIAPYTAKHNKNFIDPQFLKIAVYRDVIDELVANEKNPSKNLQQVKDWIAARDMAQQLKRASDRESKMKFEPTIAALGNDSYRVALSNTLNKVLQLSNGDMAFDFAAMDADGKTSQLSNLKGKLIYVDLWATWCGPCLQEMPAYEKLKESYKDNPSISFISLSIDDNKDAWKKNMQQRNAQGFQWIVDRAKLQPYNIMSIPRSILVDKDFHIVEMNAALPSSKNISTTLNLLLK
ncbi:MAG: Thiol-disulfide isomerase or thioredoxin [Sediminibacterium sp.]|nr:Thiol-disulfide isomerase or thioredoxin [Sediminibacterium sp.]